MFCKYCGAKLSKSDIKCPSCGKEQGELFSTNGYFGVLDKIDGQAEKDKDQLQYEPVEKKHLNERSDIIKAEKSSQSQISKDTILLVFLIIVCTLAICLKVSSLKKVVSKNEDGTAILDSLSQTLARIEENQQQQDETLAYLKQAVDYADREKPTEPVPHQQNADSEMSKYTDTTLADSEKATDDNDTPLTEVPDKSALIEPNSMSSATK